MPWPERYHARQPHRVPANRASAPRLPPSPARSTSFEPEIARAFGAVTRQTRVDLGVAQDQMALIAGVDRSYFGKLERGERQPSLSILLRIAGALGVSGAELVKRTEAAMGKPKGRVREK
ncbi:MAG: helix-turn-helix domain-containing protein [Burkholderiaceae bacterium]